MLPAPWQRKIPLIALTAIVVSLPIAALAGATDTPADNSPASATPPDMPGPVVLGDGFVYQGSLRDGKPDGKGVKRWPTGDWVAGDFAQGMIDGSATIHHSDGGTLIGTFRRNAPWDAVEKDPDGVVVVEYRAGVKQQVTQSANAAAPADSGQPTVQQVHSSVDVPKQ